LVGHTHIPAPIDFSPDGETLASGSTGLDSSIRLWRVSDGHLLEYIDKETGTGVVSVDFSPDGEFLAYGRFDATIVIARNPITP